MKFLQIKNTEDGKPKVLEMGKDFDTIKKDILIKHNAELLPKNESKVQFRDVFNNIVDVFNNTVPSVSFIKTSETNINISDCYKSRPLIQIDGYCEFDVQKRIAINEPDLENLNPRYLLRKNGDIEFLLLSDIFGFKSKVIDDIIYVPYWKYEGLGSIFLPENTLKYPELYAEAMKIINL